MAKNKNPKTRIAFSLKGKVAFSDLVTPKPDMSGKLRHALTLRIDKEDKEQVKTIKERFRAFVKEANIPKDEAIVLWDRMYKDGDKDEYWSQHINNHGNMVVRPYNFRMPNLWHKQDQAMVKVPVTEENIGFGDEVKVVVALVQDTYVNKKTGIRKVYRALYLQEVLVLEKNEESYDSSSKDLLAEEEGLEIKADISPEEPKKEKSKPAKKAEPDEEDLGDEDTDEDDLPF